MDMLFDETFVKERGERKIHGLAEFLREKGPSFGKNGTAVILSYENKEGIGEAYGVGERKRLMNMYLTGLANLFPYFSNCNHPERSKEKYVKAISENLSALILDGEDANE